MEESTTQFLASLGIPVFCGTRNHWNVFQAAFHLGLVISEWERCLSEHHSGCVWLLCSSGSVNLGLIHVLPYRIFWCFVWEVLELFCRLITLEMEECCLLLISFCFSLSKWFSVDEDTPHRNVIFRFIMSLVICSPVISDFHNKLAIEASDLLWWAGKSVFCFCATTDYLSF